MLATRALVDIPSCLKLSSGGWQWLPRATAEAALPLRPKSRCAVRVRALQVKAAYTKRPMETDGAYELIDEESGEKVIVWGGTDDDNSPIPSKRTISWKPGGEGKESDIEDDSGGHLTQTTLHQGNIPTQTTRGLVGGFRRLKTQKIKTLVRKASQEKLESSEENYEEVYIEETDDDDCYETSVSKNTIPRKKEHVTSKHDMNQQHERSITHVKSLEYDEKRVGESTASKSASSTLRGWGSGQPNHSSPPDPRALEQKWKKSAGSDFYSKRTFRELGCSDDMIESLRGRLFVRPSHIQAMAFSTVNEGKSCIMADQSGSGKTLAYLVPVVQRLRQEELQGLSRSSPRSPRAVVLVPTSELASQVLRTCRSMSKFGVPFRSMVATGGFRQKTQLESLDQDIDVLIVTPGRFLYLIKEGFLQLTNLRCAVLDEVDILFSDKDFELAMQNLITSSPVTTQYLFVTATLPVEIYNKLVEIFPDSEVIMGPGMHRTSSGLEEILVDCSGGDGMEKTPEMAFMNKRSALLKLVEESSVSKSIIFCNKIETCRKVENALKRFDRKGSHVRVLPFHAALAQEMRLANMKEFLSSQPGQGSLFLICTDRASRGIDFGGVDHVILFDFPRDPSEYVRRVGRTARGAGGRGKAFVFVVGKQVSLARRIMERNQKGHPLHEVPSAFEAMKY